MPTYAQTNRQPIDIASYEKHSAMMWSINNIQLPKLAPWDFTHRVWQTDIFDDTSKDLVVIKPTQIGMTTLMLCRMLHFATFNPVRVMYTLPRQDDVTDLVTGRLETMFRDSPQLASLLGSTSNVRLKLYANSFLHFMEASVAPRMLDVDYLVNDEVDLSNQDHLEQYIARLDASQYKIRVRISTPTIEEFGIHSDYQLSDQKEWMVKCPRCGVEEPMDWESNIRHKMGRTWYACRMCDKVFEKETIQNGRWIPKFPNREISGYSVSQMMVTSIPPSSLWNDSVNMKPKNFYNLRLGKAYTPAASSFTRSSIIKHCFAETHEHEFSGEGYFLGADQGNDIHVIVGRRNGDVLEIVHMEVIPLEQGFGRLEELINRYGIKMSVVDALPNRHSANTLAQNYDRRVMLAFYTTASNLRYYRQDASNNRVDIARSEAFDAMHSNVIGDLVKCYGSKSALTSEQRTFVDHLSNLKRDEVMSLTRLQGERVEVNWIATGPDHFGHALSYLMVAADIGTSSRPLVVRSIGDSDKKQNEILRAKDIADISASPIQRALRRIGV